MDDSSTSSLRDESNQSIGHKLSSSGGTRWFVAFWLVLNLALFGYTLGNLKREGEGKGGIQDGLNSKIAETMVGASYDQQLSASMDPSQLRETAYKFFSPDSLEARCLEGERVDEGAFQKSSIFYWIAKGDLDSNEVFEIAQRDLGRITLAFLWLFFVFASGTATIGWFLYTFAIQRAPLFPSFPRSQSEGSLWSSLAPIALWDLLVLKSLIPAVVVIFQVQSMLIVALVTIVLDLILILVFRSLLPPRAWKFEWGSLWRAPFLTFGILIFVQCASLVLVWLLQDMLRSNNQVLNMLDKVGRVEFYSLMILATVIGPLIEEFLFRGVLIENLLKTGRWGPWGTALLSGFLFALVHLDPQASIALFLLGFLLSWVYMRWRSLWLCWLIHGLFNLNTFIVIGIFLGLF